MPATRSRRKGEEGSVGCSPRCRGGRAGADGGVQSVVGAVAFRQLLAGVGTTGGEIRRVCCGCSGRLGRGQSCPLGAPGCGEAEVTKERARGGFNSSEQRRATADARLRSWVVSSTPSTYGQGNKSERCARGLRCRGKEMRTRGGWAHRNCAGERRRPGGKSLSS